MMTGATSPVVQQKHSLESLGPRGLSTKQQQDIATAQSHLSQQRRRSFGTAYGQTSSLYVGELDVSVEESVLVEVFSSIGSVERVHICRDAITNKSLGYAYVHFNNDIDGARAVQALNYTLIKGKPCRIMWTHNQNPNKSKTTHGNIFVKNLDPAVTTKSLLDTFSLYGHVTSCKIVTDERGRSKGYGFIHYDTAEAAERAIHQVNGMTLYDREIFVGHHIPKQERLQRLEEAKQRYTNVYVKNLVTDITEEELKELFGGFGPIASVLIQRDEQGYSRGFGFVNFERHEDAEKAVSQMHATEYIGKRLFVSRAQKRSEREEELRRQHDQHPLRHERSSKYHGVNLYVKNLAENVDDDMLRDLFSSFGNITSAKVMRDEKTSQSKGFGFVCFTTPDEASKAVSEMNGKSVMNKTIYAALAQKKEDRRHQLEVQMSQQRNQLMNLQQPFVPVPINAYMNSGPIYYDPYPQHSYPPQSGMVTPRPTRYHAAPPPAAMIKQGYVAGPLAYPSYNVPSHLNHARPPPPPLPPLPQSQHATYDNNGHLSPLSHPTTPLNNNNATNNDNNNNNNNNRKNSNTSKITEASVSYDSSTSPRPERQYLRTETSDENSIQAADDKSNNDSNSYDDHDNDNDNDDDGDKDNNADDVLTAESLAIYPLEMQKQVLGERIYKVVNTKYSSVAGKVTGMLLEMDVADLIYLVKHHNILEERVQEALAVLEEHQHETKVSS